MQIDINNIITISLNLNNFFRILPIFLKIFSNCDNNSQHSIEGIFVEKPPIFPNIIIPWPLINIKKT